MLVTYPFGFRALQRSGLPMRIAPDGGGRSVSSMGEVGRGGGGGCDGGEGWGGAKQCVHCFAAHITQHLEYGV